MARYGTVNSEYLATWFTRADPGGPMWALNLMQYRERAEYLDGRTSTLTGWEADDEYMPHRHLAEVGSRIILLAPVVHQIRGDGRRWDRIAIAHYRDRMAMIEMTSSDEFKVSEQHKDAGMEFSIVLATFPVEGEMMPPDVRPGSGNSLMLLQVVGDSNAPDLADGLESTRIGRFWVEGLIIGDQRRFAESRFDLISIDAAAELRSRQFVHDDSGYDLILEPTFDEVARSLADPSSVRF